MQDLESYGFSIVAAALICGVLRTILGDKGTAAGMGKLICGIFLTFTVLKPVAQLDLNDLESIIFPEGISGEEAVSTGSLYAWESMAAIIKEESEAYILDKARSLNTQITVQIKVSQDPYPVPERVRICGNLPPAIRRQLQTILESDLGIPKERQTWITED